MKRSVKFVAVVALLAALGLGLWPSFSGAQQPSPTGTVPPGIIVKAPGESDLKVEIRVSPGPYIAGRQVEADFITFNLNKQAVVYLLLINPEKEITISGVTSKVREVRLLFPNREFRGNFLQKGEYKFPGPGLWERPFEIAGPPGTAYVQVIATPVSIGLEPEIFQEPFPVLNSDPEEVKKDIERRIQQKGLVPADWAATWTQFEVLRNVPLTPQPTGGLIVQVFDQSTRKPLGGANIFVGGILRERPTDEKGQVTIPNLSPGRHQVMAARYGYKDSTKTVEILQRPDNIVLFELEPLPRRAALTATPPYPVPVLDYQLVTLDASASTGPIILYEWDFQSDGVIDKRTLKGESKVEIVPYGAGLRAGPNKATVIVVFEDATIATESVLISVVGANGVVGEPGTTVIKGTDGRVNPITLEIKEGTVSFVVIHSGYSLARQHGAFQVGRDKQTNKWLPAMLTFWYNFKELPVTTGVKSFVRLVFFSKYNAGTQKWECVTLDGREDKNCEGTKDLYLAKLPAKADTWDLAEFKVQFPEQTLYVVATAELEVSRNTTGKPVKIEYRHIELKSK
jgi:hypothetical protein